MKRIVMLGATALLATACQSLTTETPALEATLSSGFGDAVRANIEAMAITPTDEQLNNRYIPADRERAALAMQAYRSGEVEDLEAVQTGGGS